LSSRKVLKRFEDNAEAHEKGQKEDESYGTEKAKVHSERLRVARNRLRETGSILIIISQTRDKIGAMAFQETKTRSGGRALRFFADVELWTSVVSQLTKTVKGKKRNVGAIIQIKVKKNRVTGKHRTIEVPFREDYGVDDTLGCINYLIEEGHWKGTEATVKAASEFGFNGGSKDDLIQDIESGNQLGKLRKLVTQVHREVEDALAPDRKKRYV